MQPHFPTKSQLSPLKKILSPCLLNQSWSLRPIFESISKDSLRGVLDPNFLRPWAHPYYETFSMWAPWNCVVSYAGHTDSPDESLAFDRDVALCQKIPHWLHGTYNLMNDVWNSLSPSLILLSPHNFTPQISSTYIQVNRFQGFREWMRHKFL